MMQAMMTKKAVSSANSTPRVEAANAYNKWAVTGGARKSRKAKKATRKAKKAKKSKKANGSK
jgi:hypothetical protein